MKRSTILSPLAVSIFLLATVSVAAAGFQETASGFQEELKKTTRDPNQNQNQNPGVGDPFTGIPGGFFPSGGFPIPGGVIGGGYGAGFGGPKGGYSRGGVYRPVVSCSTPGPCYKKRLVCPASCFRSFSQSGKNYGAGGGGGGCTIDCKKRCIAYC